MPAGDIAHVYQIIDGELAGRADLHEYTDHIVRRVAIDLVDNLLGDADPFEEVTVVMKIGKRSTRMGSIVVVGAGAHCSHTDVPSVRHNVERDYQRYR